MELAWLQDFLTLCSSGNFSRAAEQRHVTQPAFSRRIRSLEEWMGVELFDRTTHPTFLTAAGKWFKPVAEEMVRRTLAAREEAQAIAAGSLATLNFAATHALSLTFFPRWLRKFESSWPPESPAYASYHSRIVNGPPFSMASAAPPERAAPVAEGVQLS